MDKIKQVPKIVNMDGKPVSAEQPQKQNTVKTTAKSDLYYVNIAFYNPNAMNALVRSQIEIPDEEGYNKIKRAYESGKNKVMDLKMDEVTTRHMRLNHPDLLFIDFVHIKAGMGIVLTGGGVSDMRTKQPGMI